MLEELAEKIISFFFSLVPRSQPKKDSLKNAKIIAHRGAHHKPSGIIENTDPAFERATALGCWGIEIDIHATADKQIVVNHDPTLKRLWGHPQAIGDLSYQELHQLAPQIPLLSDVINKYGESLHFFIELKAPFCEEEQLLQDLKNLTACKDYHLITLDEDIFSAFSKFPKEAMLLVATLGNTKRYCQTSLEKGYAGVLGHYLLLNQGLVTQLKAANQKIGVGFIDSRFSLYREVNRGLYWLFSNHADRVCSKT